MSTVSAWQAGLREPPLSCDVAVVGAGIAGASAAYWLRQLRPALGVMLLDAERPGAGASGRNAGFVLQGAGSDYALDVHRHGPSAARRLWNLTRENRDLIASDLGGSAAGFEATGSLVAAGDAEEDARLRRAFALMRADGLPAAYLPARAFAERTLSRGFFGGLYTTTGGVVHPARLVARIVAASGADVRPNHRAATVERLTDGRLRVTTSARDVVADAVVLALNAYAPRVVPALSAWVRPVRAQMLATAPGGPRELSPPVYSHEGYYYLRQLDDGAVLVGGARHRHAAAEIGYEDATTTALQADLEGYLAHHFPSMATAPVARRWSGTMGFSPDGLPVVGAVPGLPGAVAACGFTGHGMAYGVRIGRMLAEMALGNARPADADLFAPERLT